MAHSLRDPAHCGGKVWQQRREKDIRIMSAVRRQRDDVCAQFQQRRQTDVHIMSAVRKQRGDVCAQLTSSSSFTPEPQAHAKTPPQLVGLSEFSLEILSQTFSEAWVLDRSRSCQIDNQD